MQYDVEADFYPLTTCNFRCDYCFLSKQALGAKIVVHGTNEQWQDGFDSTGKTWLIHMTGGEPMIYPKFVDLCQRLTRRHYLSINSNLSHRAVDEFAEVIDPRRVHFINAALHLVERRQRSGFDAFIGRVQKLQSAGFTAFVLVVMTPPVLARFPKLVQIFQNQGLNIVPKVMRGTVAGRRFPDAYSEAERQQLRQYISEAKSAHEPVLARMSEMPNHFSEHFLQVGLTYRGQLCGAGHNFVQVRPNGNVLRCGSGQQLGNILSNTVELLPSSQICDTSYCPSFCQKYTLPRFAQAVGLQV
jgi:sulfatase maturation enzyme AslB (radical SAM superfamily)